MRAFKFGIIFFLLSCFSGELFSQNVRIIFINKTAKTIDSLVANEVFIGQLKPDEKSEVFTFDHLSFESSGHEIIGEGLLDNQAIKSIPEISFCGSGPYQIVREGDFLYYIKSYTIDSVEYFVFDPQP